MSEHPFRFDVGMPQMAPGRLSEPRLLEILGDLQWRAIGRALAAPTDQWRDSRGQRLYATFVSLDLVFPDVRPLWSIGEGAPIAIHSDFSSFMHRFVEGRFVLERGGHATLTSTFVVREGTNTGLRVAAAEGLDAAALPVLAALPAGIVTHRQAAEAGSFRALNGVNLGSAAEFAWPVHVESDLNGVGLVYFARYVAIMDAAVRRFVSERLGRPVSLGLALALVTEARRLAWFANADATDTIRCVVRGAWLDAPEVEVPGARIRAGKLAFQVDLYRASDGVWMATTHVNKALAIPATDKATLQEARRLRASIVGP